MKKDTTKPVSDIQYTPKRRNCLMCNDSFQSEWAGERICKRCKSNDSWRSGNSLHAA